MDLNLDGLIYQKTEYGGAEMPFHYMCIDDTIIAVKIRSHLDVDVFNLALKFYYETPDLPEELDSTAIGTTQFFCIGCDGEVEFLGTRADMVRWLNEALDNLEGDI